MFVYQAHEVGGREAHKIVGVEFFVLPSQLRFPTPFYSNFVGGWSNVWVNYNGGVSTKKNIVGCSPTNEALNIKSCSTEFPVLLRDKKM